MDLFLPIVLFIVFCVLFSICGWCCKKHREGTVYGCQPNVNVTTQPAATVVPPYPIDPRQPLPQTVPPGPGFGYQTAPYPPHTSPYPPAPVPGFYPMPNGGYPPATPYPVTVMAPYPQNTTPYPPTNTAPYPTGTTAPYPAGTTAPYPTHQQPPSYVEAVGHPPSEPRTTNEGYSKQTPYNPNY